MLPKTYKDWSMKLKQQSFGEIKNELFFFKNEDRLIPGGRAIKDYGGVINLAPRCLRDSNIFRWAAKKKSSRPRDNCETCACGGKHFFS